MVRFRVLLVLLVAATALAPLLGPGADAKNRHPVARTDADAVRTASGDPGDVTDRYIVAVTKNSPDPGTVADRLASNASTVTAQNRRRIVSFPPGCAACRAG